MMGPLQGFLVPNFMLLAHTVSEILADLNTKPSCCVPLRHIEVLPQDTNEINGSFPPMRQVVFFQLFMVFLGAKNNIQGWCIQNWLLVLQIAPMMLQDSYTYGCFEVLHFFE